MNDRMKYIISSIDNQISSQKPNSIPKRVAEPEDDNPPVKKTILPTNMYDDFPNPIDEDVMEGKCLSDDTNTSYNEEEVLSMVVSSLRNISANVLSIINNINLERVKQNLTEPWVFGKLSVIDDNMTSVHDFVKFAEESDDTSDAGAKPGLWDNIRKKKEKEGKNYRPSKPGDKDRPDPEQWKKLTKDTDK